MLNEWGFALARAGHPVAASVRFVRTWVVPLVAVVLFFRWVALLPPTGLAVRLTESLCLAVAIIAIIGVINNVVFESAQPGSWQRKVPRLLRDLIRLLLVAIGLAMVYSFVWGREIENALAALGVTSIVVGLALQEPLGNLFSGLMLLMERPFEVGETIEVGSVVGRGERGQLAVGAHRGDRRRHHGRPQFDPEQGDDHQFLATAAAAHGNGRRRVQPSGSPIQGAAGLDGVDARDRGRAREAEADCGDAWLR